MQDLVGEAIEARSRSYSPYSRFPVGAALRTASGRVFRGCNVENVSYGLTLCAERVAAGAAVAAGETAFEEIAIVADTAEPVVPCGACRQFLAEFNPDLKITSATLAGVAAATSLRDLLPHPKRGILNSGDV